MHKFLIEPFQAPPSEQHEWFLACHVAVTASEQEGGEVDSVVWMKMGQDYHIDIVNCVAVLQQSPHDGRTYVDEYIAPCGRKQIGR